MSVRLQVPTICLGKDQIGNKANSYSLLLTEAVNSTNSVQVVATS